MSFLALAVRAGSAPQWDRASICGGTIVTPPHMIDEVVSTRPAMWVRKIEPREARNPPIRMGIVHINIE